MAEYLSSMCKLFLGEEVNTQMKHIYETPPSDGGEGEGDGDDGGED